MRKIVIILSSIIVIAAQQKQSVDIRPDVLFERANDAYTNVNAAKSAGNSSYNSILDDVTVSTFAGSGEQGSADGTGTAASFYGPSGIAMDASGNLFVTDTFNHLIRKITPSGVVTTFAGTGTAGSANGTRTEASFNKPIDLDFDNNGNLFVVDFGNHLIRRIKPSGVVTTFAGTGEPGSNDDSWGGAAARFNNPFGIAIFKKEGWSWTNNLFIADYGNHSIRMITNGDEDDAYNGETTTFAGSGTAGSEDNEAFGQASFNGPVGLSWDADYDHLYVTEWFGHNIRKIDNNYDTYGVSTFAGTGTAGSADGTGTEASFYNPVGITIDNNGNFYIADASNHKIRKITSAGVVTTLAGTGTKGTTNGTAAEATFYKPYGLELGQNNGAIYVAEHSNKLIRKIIISTPPVIASISDVTIKEDETATVTLSATDAESDPITFSVKNNNVAGNFLNFDGVDDWVQTKNASGEEDHPIPDEGDFTISAWAKASSLSSGLMEIVSQGQAGSNFYLGSHHTGDIIRAGDGWEDTGVTFPRDDQWHHYVLSKSASNTYLYLDGSLAATKGSAIGNPSGGSGLRIGRQYGTAGEYFYGVISEVAVWEDELSATEIKTIYNSGSFLSPMRDTLGYSSADDVSIYYPLNEGTGSTVQGTEYNSSEAFTGEIKGGAEWTVIAAPLVTATISGSTLTLAPDANWNGEAHYTVSASDGYSASSTNFNLTVTPVQDAPAAFEWVSTASDTINISQTNVGDTYELKWSESIDVDGETIDYLLHAQLGVYLAEEVYDTTSTSVQITYEEFLEPVFELFPMLPGATVRFSLVATDGIDTVKVTGDDRVLFVNRYDYLSIAAEGVPLEFALHDNYPNPFNPTTTLRFDLPEVSNITLTIYNMLGQKVRTFDYQNTSAGYHSVIWDATNDLGQQEGAGVYFCLLYTSDAADE